MPWLGDACGLVDAFRAGELSPLEALEACIAAMETSPLNAFSFTDFERAEAAARQADVSRPFGGVPFGIKELEKVEGWPYTEASVIFRDRVSDHDDTSLVPPARQRGGARRPDGGTGVRGHQLHLDRIARDDAQSLEPRADAGRVVGRDGGGGRRRPPADRDRQ